MSEEHQFHSDERPRLMAQAGHFRHIICSASSPNGLYLCTGGSDKLIILWSIETGKILWRFEDNIGTGYGTDITSVAFTQDGLHVLSGNWDGKVLLWSLRTGKLVKHFSGHWGRVSSIACSPDGKYMVTGGWDRTTILWSLESGKKIRKIRISKDAIRKVAFAPDSKLVYIRDHKGNAFEWSSKYKKNISLEKFEKATPDSPITERHKEIMLNRGTTLAYYSSDISSDGQHLVVSGITESDHQVVIILWSLDEMKEIKRLIGHEKSAFSPNGLYLTTISKDKNKAYLWSVKSGQELKCFSLDDRYITAISITDHFLLTSHEETLILWSLSTGEEVKRFTLEPLFDIESIVISSKDSAAIAIGRSKKNPDKRIAVLWSIETGIIRKRIKGPLFGLAGLKTAAFSTDGSQFLLGDEIGTFNLWSLEKGRRTKRFAGARNSEISGLAASSNGKYFLSVGISDGVTLWSTTNGNKVRSFGSAYGITSAVFSPDNKFVITTGLQLGLSFWSTETGDRILTYYSFVDGSWAVIDEAGRFDATNGGDVQGLHWVVDLEPIDLFQLKERYYEPGLLAKVLGRNKEPLRDVGAIEKHGIGLHPFVEITHVPSDSEPYLDLFVINRGGGIGRIMVKINGKEVVEDARPSSNDEDIDSFEISLDLKDNSLLYNDQESEIKVIVYNAEGSLSSRGERCFFKRKEYSIKQHPKLWAIIGGVSDYQGDKIDLRFAAKDAQDFATALRVGAELLFGGKCEYKKCVHIEELHDEIKPLTRANLLEAFGNLKEAKSTDILLVYLAGHGINFSSPEGENYYYLLQEATTSNLQDPAIRKQTAISSSELTELIKQVPATKQVLILDTCQAGRLIDDLGERKKVSSVQDRSLQRLKDRTGMFVLAGSASDSVSYEASRYGQGILTYSLLEGMRGGALKEGALVNVSKLFDYAIDRVPGLAKGIGGVQQPRLAIPKGGESFDVGYLPTIEDREKIPLALERALILRVNFEDEGSFFDDLGISTLVNNTLREVGEKISSRLVFIDVLEFPGAHYMRGRYIVKGSKIKLRFNIRKDREGVGSFEIEGRTDELRELANQIVEKTKTVLK